MVLNGNQPSISLYHAALELARAGKTDEAEQQLRLLLTRHPQHPDVLHLLGVVLLESDRLIEAVKMFRDAIVMRPEQPQFHYHHGLALLHNGDLAGAEKAFNGAVQLDDSFHDARYNLAKLVREKGDFEKAATVYKDLLKRYPTHVDALYNLANLCYEMDMLPEAEALFNQLLSQSPHHLNARVNLALIKDRSGQKDQAVKILEKTLEIDPAHQHAKDLLRRLYSKTVASWHFDMLNDEERNRNYEAAITNIAGNARHVLEIGTGSGLLAMMASRAGARKVTTCEMVKPLATVAKKIIEKNGYGDRIQVISKKSTQIRFGEDFDELADVLIAEVFDNGLLGEHFLPALLHAKRNLLKEGAIIIPAAATIYAILISCPQLRRVNPVKVIAGFDLSDFDVFRHDGYKQINLEAVDHLVLTKPVAICRLDFQNEMPSQTRQKVTMPIHQSGTCHAVAYWFDLHLDEKNTISTLNTAHTNHWKQAIQFLKTDYSLETGTVVELNVTQEQTGFDFALNMPNEANCHALDSGAGRYTSS